MLVPFLSFAALAQASALFWDTDKSYTRPQTIKHTCTSAQSKGVEFKWTDISTGDVSTYEGFTFTGFKVSTDFHGYVGKYLEGKLTTNASDLQVAMEDGAEFSVSLLNFATSKETEIQVIYGMSDGTTCKNTASSGPNMTDIANQQCGGAISMGFQVPESEGDGDITLAFYSIDFYCPQLTSGSNSKRGLSARNKIGAEAPLDATVFSTNEVTITSCGPEKPDCPASSTAVPSTESVGAGMPSSAAAESSAPWTPGAPSTESVSVGVPSSAAPESSVAPSTPVTPVETSSSAFTPSEVASPPVDSTVFSTNEVTITSCGPEVPDCPASSTALPSSTEAVSAGIPSSAAAESSIAPSTPVTPVHAETSSNSVFASSWSTSASPSHLDATVFSTNEVTVTSCGPEVTDCPASSTSLGVGFLSSFTPPAESSVPGGWGSSVSPVETTLSSFESSWVISSSAAVTSSAVIASTSTSIELGSWSWSASASASASASVETSSSIAVSSIGSVVPSDSTLTETVSGFVPAGSMGASSVPVASTPVSSTPVRPTKSTVYSSAAPLTSTRPAIPSRSSSIPVISSSRAVIPTPESSSAIPSVTPTEEGTTTLVTYETVTTCPITSTHYSGGSAVTSVYSTLSTLTLTSTSTVCTACKSGSAAAASSVMPTPTSTSVISSVPVSVPASSLSASSTPILSSWGMSSHASSDHVSTTEGTTTLVTYETVTTCPITSTYSSGGSSVTSVFSTVSTLTLTSTSMVCTACLESSAATASSSATTTSIAVSVPAPRPSSAGTSALISSAPVSSYPVLSSIGITPTSSEQATTTLVTYETVTTCPITSTYSSGESSFISVFTTLSTQTLTSTSTVCTTCKSSVAAASSSATPTSIAVSVPAPAGPSSSAGASVSISSGPISSYPASSSIGIIPPGSTEEATTTLVTYETVTTCPITSTYLSGESSFTSLFTTLSTQTLTSTSTVCAACKSSAAAASTSATPTSSPPPSPSSSSGEEISVIPVPSIPASSSSSKPVSSTEGTTTLVTYETVTTCPITSTYSSGGSSFTSVFSTVSTQTLTSTSTVCTACLKSSVAPTSVSVSVPASPRPWPSSFASVSSVTSSTPVASTEEGTTTLVTYETVTTCPITSTYSSGGSSVTSVFNTVSTLTLTSSPTASSPWASVSVSTSSSIPAIPAFSPSSTPVSTRVWVPAAMFASTPTPKPGSSLLSSRDTPSSADDTTLVTYESVTSVLVTQLMPSAEMFKTLVHDSASTLTLTSTSTICATCKTTDTATPTTLSTSTISLFSAYNPLTSSSPSQPFSPSSPSCPEIVPRCINTWLDSVPKCSSNSDVSCFCPKSSFTNHVIGCIQSWAGSEEEVSAGIGYFVGICAGYVSENPGIVTGVPGSVSIAPVTGTATGDVSATAVSYGTRTFTVPEVSFTTDAAASASGSQVQLVPGAPATTLSSSATSTTSSTTQTPWSPTWITSTTSDGSSSATPSSTHTGRASKVEVGRGLGVGVVGVVFAGLLF